ncbi:MAG: NUDIX hydrolase [Patescibacteria group bacterium]
MLEQKPRKGLPENAKMVFKGLIFEIWQWEQKMFDGSTDTFEKIWRIPTVEVIPIVGDKIIIEEQDQPNRPGKITLVSGRADRGDDLLEEAKRELLEETGYGSDKWELLLDHPGEGKILHQISCFIARDCQKIQEPELDAGEKIRIKMIDFDEFLMLSDDSRFWAAPHFVNLLLRARFDEAEKEKLRKMIFG